MAIPAAMAVASDPIASLIDTAFIGHIGMCVLNLKIKHQTLLYPNYLFRH